MMQSSFSFLLRRHFELKLLSLRDVNGNEHFLCCVIPHITECLPGLGA